MQNQIKKLYEMGVPNSSFIGLNSTPTTENTRQNNHNCFNKGSNTTGYIKYVTFSDDYRLSIQRDSIAF